MSDPLKLWTVYDHPRDFPNSYVARMFTVDGKGAVPTAYVIVRPTLEQIRRVMKSRGLTRLARSPGDDPNIVETWV